MLRPWSQKCGDTHGDLITNCKRQNHIDEKWLEFAYKYPMVKVYLSNMLSLSLTQSIFWHCFFFLYIWRVFYHQTLVTYFCKYDLIFLYFISLTSYIQWHYMKTESSRMPFSFFFGDEKWKMKFIFNTIRYIIWLDHLQTLGTITVKP